MSRILDACGESFIANLLSYRAAEHAPDGPLSAGTLGLTGAASRCPSARLRVEKIEGGLLVAGVVVAANCQLALPAFGCLFLLAGCVLTGEFTTPPIGV